MSKTYYVWAPALGHAREDAEAVTAFTDRDAAEDGVKEMEFGSCEVPARVRVTVEDSTGKRTRWIVEPEYEVTYYARPDKKVPKAQKPFVNVCSVCRKRFRGPLLPYNGVHKCRRCAKGEEQEQEDGGDE